MDIFKPNPHLENLPEARSGKVLVNPNAKYALDLDAVITPPSSWVTLGSMITSSTDNYAKQVNLEFHVSGQRDLSVLSAVLNLNGEVQSKSVKSTPVTIRSRVMGTPSFEHSKFRMPSKITTGQSVMIGITAIDVDGLHITESAGRFFVATWLKPDGTENQKTSAFDGKSFVIDLPGY